MKATLATLACLLTVGFLSAAEVTGNNTAVVIRKNVVKSDTHYQFLCVPVDGLDIANGTQKTVKLSTVLPANTLPNNTKVTFIGGDYTNVTPTVSGGVWSADPGLKGGQIFWLYTPETSTPAPAPAPATMMGLSRTVAVAEGEGEGEGEEQPDTVIFCGQNRERDELVSSLGSGVTALKNDSSQEITLDQAVNMQQGFTPDTDDQILTIKAGSAEYKIYTYDSGVWYGEGFGSAAIADGANARIAPGEAFYYFKAN